MRNILLEKSYTKFGGKASLCPFYKKIISLDQKTKSGLELAYVPHFVYNFLSLRFLVIFC